MLRGKELNNIYYKRKNARGYFTASVRVLQNTHGWNIQHVKLHIENCRVKPIFVRQISLCGQIMHVGTTQFKRKFSNHFSTKTLGRNHGTC